MNSRERVLAALEFRSPDRVPRDLWTLPWVGMAAGAEHGDLVKEFPFDFCWGGGYLGKSDRASGQAGRKGTFVDEWGCVWTAGEDGVVGEVKTSQLREGGLVPDLAGSGEYRNTWSTSHEVSNFVSVPSPYRHGKLGQRDQGRINWKK